MIRRNPEDARRTNVKRRVHQDGRRRMWQHRQHPAESRGREAEVWTADDHVVTALIGDGIARVQEADVTPIIDTNGGMGRRVLRIRDGGVGARVITRASIKSRVVEEVGPGAGVRWVKSGRDGRGRVRPWLGHHHRRSGNRQEGQMIGRERGAEAGQRDVTRRIPPAEESGMVRDGGPVHRILGTTGGRVLRQPHGIRMLLGDARRCYHHPRRD